jgi:hypothetical protein
MGEFDNDYSLGETITRFLMIITGQFLAFVKTIGAHTVAVISVAMAAIGH